METIILVGGFGTRLRLVVSDVPKPLASVQGRPFLEWLMSYCVAHGSSRFILGIGYMADSIISRFGDSFQGVPVSYSREKEQLGTGGATRRAIGMVSGNAPVRVMNGDSFCSIDHLDMLRVHENCRSDCTIALFPAHRQGSFGRVLLRERDRIVGFDEASAALGEWANAGIYIFSPDLLRRMDSFGDHFSLEKQAFPALIKDGCRLTAYMNTVEIFIDIGTPEDYRLAQGIEFDNVFNALET